MPIRKLFFATGFSALLCWILVVGKTVILPFVIAVMLSYVLVGAMQAIRRQPALSRIPVWLAYVVVLLLFGLAVVTIGLVAIGNLRNIAQSAPLAQENVLAIVGRVTQLLGGVDSPNWDTVREMTLDRLDLTDLSLSLLSSIASASGYTVLIATYVVFLVAERTPLSAKIDLVLHSSQGRGAARNVLSQINDQIVTYLSTKTLINVALGVVSWALMKLLGIENAVFWAFVIGVFNYIPYVGSLLGVAVVVIYVAMMTADLSLTIMTMILLTLAQVVIGNYFEPRVMSRSLNLSPVVVLFALVVWAAIWGLAGAIIAVPMTSIVMIILASFDSTRPIAVLASRDGTL